MAKEKNDRNVGDMALEAAVYAVIDAALACKDHNIQLQGNDEDPTFFVAVLKEEEMALVLQSREAKEG